MLPSLGIGQQGTGGHGPCQGNALFVVKQLKQISSSPIRSRDSLKGGSGGGGGNGIRTRSADCEQMRKSSEETVNQSQGNTNPQSLAVSRVMKSIRKQRLIQQQTEVHLPSLLLLHLYQEEMKRDRILRAEKLQMKNTQRHRQRAEVYAINAYLKAVEQQRYEEMMKAKSRGESSRVDPFNYDSDSSVSHGEESGEEDSDQPQKSSSEQHAAGREMKKKSLHSPSPTAQGSKAPSRSYGV
jgi:hypothetical protein